MQYFQLIFFSVVNLCCKFYVVNKKLDMVIKINWKRLIANYSVHPSKIITALLYVQYFSSLHMNDPLSCQSYDHACIITISQY